MIQSTMSLQGIYNYSPDIFEGFILPDGMEREDAIFAILDKASSFELLRPNASYMRIAIGHWARMNIRTWKKLWHTETVEYDPIENYDRMEEWTDSGESVSVDKSKYASDRQENSESSSGGVSTTKTAAFNTVHQVPQNENTSEQTGTGESVYAENGKNDSDGASTYSVHHVGRTHGDIGVNTTQQMLVEERKVAPFSTYGEIAQSFVEKFCVMVY